MALGKALDQLTKSCFDFAKSVKSVAVELIMAVKALVDKLFDILHQFIRNVILEIKNEINEDIQAVRVLFQWIKENGRRIGKYFTYQICRIGTNFEEIEIIKKCDENDIPNSVKKRAKNANKSEIVDISEEYMLELQRT